ncbi:hypothetical protein HID58_072453 [Brassica napus]|uniref:Uncharacterized protein n=1 Tax=Brassica napus TaxID=3708 RepID=A0ABQ7Z4M2_BRANA|nr:hypothetical protein HID58_072453 [Brassica napus]
MATGQLFSRTTQALFYNYKQLPVQPMLDFDFLCGWILWLPFLAFLRFTQQCRGESEPLCESCSCCWTNSVGAASRSEALKEEVLATSLLEDNPLTELILYPN